MAAHQSIWQMLSPPDRYPRLDCSTVTDVAIVGAGIVGLSASIHLRTMGCNGRILLLERGTVGAGATGRSGGILYFNEGYLPGSSHHYRFFRNWLERLDISDLINSGSGRLAGVSGEEDWDVLNPQLLCNRLAAHAASLGVEIRQDSQVQAWREAGNHLVLELDDLQVTARAALIATGAHSSPDLLRQLGLAVRDEDCLVVASSGAPIPWTFWGSAGDDDYVWGRRVAGDQFLFGGGNRYSSPNAKESERVNRLLGGLFAHFPYLRESRLVVHWSGFLARFNDGKGWRVLRLSLKPRVLFVGGFDGLGLLAGCSAGSEAASEILRTLT